MTTMSAKTHQAKHESAVQIAPLVLMSIIVLLGAAGAFAYMSDGAHLFVTMVENGLAWCF